MGILLHHQHTWLTPLFYPQLSKAAVDALGGLSEWVYEYTTPPHKDGEAAVNAHEIHPDRLDCPLGHGGMLREFYAFDGAPDASSTKRNRTLDRGLAELLLHGVIRARYRFDRKTEAPENHPTHTLIGWLEPALARAVALRDGAAHLAAHPIDVVLINGVATDAKPLHGHDRGVREFERIVEVHKPDPDDPTGTADLLMRKVELEWVGELGGVEHPEWRPDGHLAAGLFYSTLEVETGHKVKRTPLPQITYAASRPVVTEGLLDLLPTLSHLPTRMRPTEGAETVTSTPSRPPRKPAPKRTNKGGSIPASAWAAVGVDRGGA